MHSHKQANGSLCVCLSAVTHIIYTPLALLLLIYSKMHNKSESRSRMKIRLDACSLEYLVICEYNALFLLQFSCKYIFVCVCVSEMCRCFIVNKHEPKKPRKSRKKRQKLSFVFFYLVCTHTHQASRGIARHRQISRFDYKTIYSWLFVQLESISSATKNHAPHRTTLWFVVRMAIHSTLYIKSLKKYQRTLSHRDHLVSLICTRKSVKSIMHKQQTTHTEKRGIQNRRRAESCTTI